MSPSVRRRADGCPSRLTLDELEAGDLAGLPEEAWLRDHLAQCARCRGEAAARTADPAVAPRPGEVQALVQAGATASSATAPASGGAVAAPASGGAVAPLGRGRPRRVAAFAAAAAAGVAAAALLVVGRGGGGGDERRSAGERAKGTVTLTVHIKRDAAGAVERVNDDGELRSGQEMRFSLVASEAGHAVVLGLDASPAVTTYVPAGGGAAAPIAVGPGPASLPGMVIADATPGFERLVAVVCATATPVEKLRRQAERALAAAGNRPQDVSSLGTGCFESSVLLRKVPPP